MTMNIVKLENVFETEKSNTYGSTNTYGSKFLMVQKPDNTCRVLRTNLYNTINSFHLYLWTVHPCTGGYVGRWAIHYLDA
jgi:hypothetical protein